MKAIFSLLLAAGIAAAPAPLLAQMKAGEAMKKAQERQKAGETKPDCA